VPPLPGEVQVRLFIVEDPQVLRLGILSTSVTHSSAKKTGTVRCQWPPSRAAKVRSHRTTRSECLLGMKGTVERGRLRPRASRHVLWHGVVDSQRRTTTDLAVEDTEDHGMPPYQTQHPCHRGDGLCGGGGATCTHRWDGSSSALLRIMRSERQEVDRPIANLWTPLGRVRLAEMAGVDDVGLRPSREERGKLCDSLTLHISV
jgi:hypothetical protein